MRPVIPGVVRGFLKCGDLADGFARVRCPACLHEYLLAFSCRGRWFCPSCHSKKVVQFGLHLRENLLYPVPHRQYVFSIPIILRTFFKYDRKLLGKLCQCVNKSPLRFFRTATGFKTGTLGAVMAIQTFGDYARWHPHIHVLLADGLFRENGVFYVMPKIDIKPLAEMFRANVLKMLKREGKIDDGLIKNLLTWKHNSGFSVHNGVRLAKDNEAGREALAQFKSILVDADAYLVQLSRYIHLNPVRVKLVATPADYPWSSYAAFIGKHQKPGWLDTGLLASFGKRLGDAVKNYQRFVEAQLSDLRKT
ncbi:MAG: hypothetical protein A2521_13390 [Deltaproteobacteria bacterium RIFOXYD12_FULL_57_12]|nr:MAG: hypothetical protein A2521_13390 [Deltaproteobacteria bacterium RIFOXYD12_FULL_57_12]